MLALGVAVEIRSVGIFSIVFVPLNVVIFSVGILAVRLTCAVSTSSVTNIEGI